MYGPEQIDRSMIQYTAWEGFNQAGILVDKAESMCRHRREAGRR